MTSNNLPLSIDDAYNQLSNAYYFKRNRKVIESSCIHCQNLGIPDFQELANAELASIYANCGIKTYPVRTSIDCLPSNVLNVYALACMNVLFRMNLQNIRRNCQFAYQTLSQPVRFQNADVLYTHNEKRLTVGDFLKVINKVTYVANPIVWALQGIDDALNNKSKTELMNYSLHIAADFLATSVKESLRDTNAKRSVAVSALMVNLAIDFLIKD